MRWWVRGDLCNEGMRGEQMKRGKEEGERRGDGGDKKERKERGGRDGRKKYPRAKPSHAARRCYWCRVGWLIDRQIDRRRGGGG